MSSQNDFRILVAVADAEIRSSLLDALGGLFTVRSVDSAAHILEILEDARYETVFLGSGMPGLSVTELLEILADKLLDVKVVIVTGVTEMHLRADAMDAGAEGVLIYPFDAREAVGLTQKLLQSSAIDKTVKIFAERESQELLDLLGDVGGVLKTAINRAVELADDDAPVLFHGEAGTGKGLLARIMALAGPGPLELFEEFYAGGKSPEEIEEKLFGVGEKKGLIDKSKSGALLIHCIGEIPMRLQDKLYRAVDFLWGQVRFIFASRTDLHGAVLRGEFHVDLWKMVENNIVLVPSLRERPEAIEKTAKIILDYYAGKMGSPVREIHSSALNLLKNHPWPGNLKELDRTIVLATGRATGRVLLPDDLPFIIPSRIPGGLEEISIEEAITSKLSPLVDTIEDLPEGELYKLVLSKLERPLFKLVLDKLGGNQVRAAKALGLHRNTLRKKIRELGISPKSPYIK